jgi:hypothetical protein
VNAALLAARDLAALPAEEARQLLALLHTGTLVEYADPRAMRALDLQRLAWARQLGSGELGPAAAERAALGLLALGHRDPAREQRAAAASATLRSAWADWVGEGEGGAGAAAPLVLEGLVLAPAASRGELHVSVGEPVPVRVAVRRLRVGSSVLDVELRRRPSGPVLRLARTHGPALLAVVHLPARYGLASVDDVEGLSPPLRFELCDRHEVVAYG